VFEEIPPNHGEERRGKKFGVCVSCSSIIEGRSHWKNTNQGNH